MQDPAAESAHAHSAASYAASYSTSASPVPDAKYPQPSHLHYQQPAYNIYAHSSYDSLDNTFAAATVHPADPYDKYMSPTHSHSPSPTPLLSTPADSPLVPTVTALSYHETTPAQYHSYPYMDHSTAAYSSNAYVSSAYDSTDYRRTKIPDMPGSHAYM